MVISLSKTHRIIQQKVWLCDCLVDRALKKIFERTLHAFRSELQSLTDQWSNYSEDGKKDVEEVFSLIEHSFDGFKLAHFALEYSLYFTWPNGFGKSILSKEEMQGLKWRNEGFAEHRIRHMMDWSKIN